MVHGGDSKGLTPLDRALVSAAVLISVKRGERTVLVSPDDPPDIGEVSQALADLASPPLQFSVARDLVWAGYGTEELRPLLLAILPVSPEEVTDATLEEQRSLLERLGPTVSSSDADPDSTPDPSPDPDDSGDPS